MGPIKLSVSKHCKIRQDKYDISGYIKTTRYSLDIKKQSARKFECILEFMINRPEKQDQKNLPNFLLN